MIIRPRQSGKTTDIIKMAVKDDAHIAVHNHEAIRDLINFAHELGYDILKPVTYHDLLHKETFMGVKNKKVIIDNLEWFARSVVRGSNAEIIAITMGEEEMIK